MSTLDLPTLSIYLLLIFSAGMVFARVSKDTKSYFGAGVVLYPVARIVQVTSGLPLMIGGIIVCYTATGGLWATLYILSPELTGLSSEGANIFISKTVMPRLLMAMPPQKIVLQFGCWRSCS